MFLQVKFDEDSYDLVNSVYRFVFIIVKIGQKIIIYEILVLLIFIDLMIFGGEIGEELWEIMNNEDEFEFGYFVKFFENEFVGVFMFWYYLVNFGSVQLFVNLVVFIVMGFILYFGFFVL